ncbi:MAG: hypothetical protein AAGB16_06325 [Pseudomonadota bacterium]
MTPESTLTETVRFTAAHAGLQAEDAASAPWLVTGAVLMAQQAAAIALRAAGDSIPAQAGATELLLRAASRDRLPAPFTLPFGAAVRQSFDRLVEARNTFMHPRGMVWHVSQDTLARGLPVTTRIVRHLILTQPVLNDLVSPDQQEQIREGLSVIDAWAEFSGELRQ